MWDEVCGEVVCVGGVWEGVRGGGRCEQMEETCSLAPLHRARMQALHVAVLAHSAARGLMRAEGVQIGVWVRSLTQTSRQSSANSSSLE